jgi:hypothetical protein
MVNSKLVVEKKRVLLDWRESGKRRRLDPMHVSIFWRKYSHPTSVTFMVGCFMVFNATFNNFSVLLVEETGEIHRPVASH